MSNQQSGQRFGPPCIRRHHVSHHHHHHRVDKPQSITRVTDAVKIRVEILLKPQHFPIQHAETS